MDLVVHQHLNRQTLLARQNHQSANFVRNQNQRIVLWPMRGTSWWRNILWPASERISRLNFCRYNQKIYCFNFKLVRWHWLFQLAWQCSTFLLLNFIEHQQISRWKFVKPFQRIILCCCTSWPIFHYLRGKFIRKIWRSPLIKLAQVECNNYTWFNQRKKNWHVLKTINLRLQGVEDTVCNQLYFRSLHSHPSTTMWHNYSWQLQITRAIEWRAKILS